MGIKFCPNCNQPVYYSFDTNDVIHECNSGNVTLDQEDVVIISSTVTEFGATVNTDVKPGEVLMQGIQNRFQGTRAGIEGENFDGVTKRGERASTHRQRQKFTFIDNLRRKE